MDPGLMTCSRRVTEIHGTKHVFQKAGEDDLSSWETVFNTFHHAKDTIDCFIKIQTFLFFKWHLLNTYGAKSVTAA